MNYEKTTEGKIRENKKMKEFMREQNKVSKTK